MRGFNVLLRVDVQLSLKVSFLIASQHGMFSQHFR